MPVERLCNRSVPRDRACARRALRPGLLPGPSRARAGRLGPHNPRPVVARAAEDVRAVELGPCGCGDDDLAADVAPPAREEVGQPVARDSRRRAAGVDTAASDRAYG